MVGLWPSAADAAVRERPAGALPGDDPCVLVLEPRLRRLELAEERLQPPQPVARVRRDLARELDRGALGLPRRRRPVQKAERTRLLHPDDASREDQLLRCCDTDE